MKVPLSDQLPLWSSNHRHAVLRTLPRCESVSGHNDPELKISFGKLPKIGLILLEYLDSTQEVELKYLHVETRSFLLWNFVIWGKNALYEVNL